MRFPIFILSTILTVLICLTSTQLKAQESYSELDRTNVFSSTKASGENGGEITPRAGPVPLNDLLIFSDEAQFGSVCNSLESENFANTNAPPDTIELCTGTLNSSTNDNCFSSGALIDGFSLIGIPFVGNGDLVVVTPPFEGITDVLVGPDEFNDDSEFIFQNGGAQAVGLNVYTLATDITVADIDIFGPGNTLLGSTTLTVTPGGQFFGILSTNSPITSVRFTNSFGELFTDLSFGDCSAVTGIPTISEWGFIVMAAALGIIGYAVLIRRKQTA